MRSSRFLPPPNVLVPVCPPAGSHVTFSPGCPGGDAGSRRRHVTCIFSAPPSAPAGHRRLGPGLVGRCDGTQLGLPEAADHLPRGVPVPRRQQRNPRVHREEPGSVRAVALRVPPLQPQEVTAVACRVVFRNKSCSSYITNITQSSDSSSFRSSDGRECDSNTGTVMFTFVGLGWVNHGPNQDQQT